MVAYCNLEAGDFGTFFARRSWCLCATMAQVMICSNYLSAFGMFPRLLPDFLVGEKHEGRIRNTTEDGKKDWRSLLKIGKNLGVDEIGR